MQKKWLWFVAAAVVAGACACSGGGAGKGNSAAAQEGLTAAEGGAAGDITGGTAENGGAGDKTGGTAENEGAGDKTGGARGAGGAPGESGTGHGEKGAEDGETDNGGSGEDKGIQNPDKEDGAGGTGDGYGQFRTGTWDGLVFSNPWLNITVTFPQGSAVLSEEDMREMVGESDDIVVNSGNYEDIRPEASKALNIYDFMVTMPDKKSSVQLAYMNAEKVAPGQEVSAGDCLDQIAGELSAIGDMGYELGDMEKVEIAGKMFDKFSASLMGGALYQEYYAVRAGDYVAIVTATYVEEGKAAVEALIEGIREAR